MFWCCTKEKKVISKKPSKYKRKSSTNLKYQTSLTIVDLSCDIIITGCKVFAASFITNPFSLVCNRFGSNLPSTDQWYVWKSSRSKKSFEYLQVYQTGKYIFPRKHQDSSKSIILYGWLKLTWPIQTFTEQAGLNSLWSTRLNLIDGNRIRNGTVLNWHGDHTPKCNFNLDIFNK